VKTKVVRTALAHWEGRDSFVAHHDNLLNTNRIGRVRLMPSRGGSDGADFAHAKPMGRPQDRGFNRAVAVRTTPIPQLRSEWPSAGPMGLV